MFDFRTGTYTLYCDGAYAASRSASFAISSSNVEVGLADHYPSNNPFSGCIDNVMIWNEALSGAQILSLIHISEPTRPY